MIGTMNMHCAMSIRWIASPNVCIIAAGSAMLAPAYQLGDDTACLKDPLSVDNGILMPYMKAVASPEGKESESAQLGL